ncbi:hypothetical protein M9Y10_005344 [Tritrichomonas musculus]|uniref:Polymorphic outer membrane protein n=1 Tax=Tritrichomonas musculus TaxID=1915356 RepID=A0ABR2JLH5_9EUKA
MFVFYFCLQLSLSKGIKRPYIKETSDEDDYKQHEPIRDSETNIDIEKCLFSSLDNLEGNGGAIFISSKKKVNCTINDCKFNECKGKNGGAISVYYTEAINYGFSLNNSIFTACECTKNGGAVYIQSAQPLYHTFNIIKCTFNNNKAVLGGGLYAELRDQLNLENCQFNNNEASTKGSSAYLKLGHENIKNGVEEHDTFKIHNNIFTFSPSSSNTVNVYIENDKITDETDPAHANVYFGGNTFTIDSSSELSSGYLHLEVVENQGLFESFNFDSCNCVHQEQITVKIAPGLNLTNFNFGCTAIDTCTPNVVTPTPPPTPDAEGYTPHEPIREPTININVQKCTFNKLDNLEGNGGAILITFSKKVSCVVNDCKFNECKGSNGGAIYASYSTSTSYKFNITNTIFTACECTEKGGAVYIQSAQSLKHTFNITGCTFSGNKASYGGGLYAELRDQLNLENCHFVNNEASTKGSSAYLKLGHENIKNGVEEHDKFKVHNNAFTFNPSTNNAVNVFIENDEITDTTDPAHANVYFGGNTFNIEGSAAVEYLHLEVVQNYGGFESFTFDSCNCVHQEQSTVSIVAKPNVTSNVILYNFMFGCESIDKCTSEQPTPPPIELPTQKPTIDAGDYQNHDPIRETEATIDIKRCLFSNLENSGGNGGAILITYSKKVNCTINDCKFNECKGNNGGAIYAQYSSADDYEFSIINTIFTACECTTRGGAVYIQSAQPLHHKFDITGCTFNGNKASYGGGLYAELRDQLNLENCHFVNNEASTKGSSAYLKLGHENIKNSVEEHDTFKVHNNVFTFNPSTNNAVNVFIENDEITDTTDPAHANVYFGGNTFNIEGSAAVEYLHLEVVQNYGGFESFTFDSCNCVHQEQSTVSIVAKPNVTSNVILYNFMFGCESIDKCTSEQPTPPPIELPTQKPTIDAGDYQNHDPIRETEATIDIKRCLFSNLENSGGNGGAILITYSKKVNCTINDCKFNECKGNNGAHANVYFGGNTFNIEGSAAVEYLHLEVVQNYGGFESFTFDSCNCVHQEQSTVSIVAKPNVTSNVILYNFMFGCESIDKCTSEQPTPPPIELPTQKPTIDAGDYQNHDPIRETEATIDIKRCLFSNLENSGGNGGAILITYSKKVNCTINDCKFNECKGNNGGAIYAQYSSADDYEFSIINTIFTACECTTRGGAVYIQSAQPLHHKFDITGCTFNGNKASYGGGLYAELRDQLNLENCHFNSNEASTKGSSAYLKLGHENIKNGVEEHDTFKVHNNVFTFKPSSNDAVNLYVENDGITDERDPAHANVFHGGNTFNIESSSESSTKYLHFEVVENAGGFESFTFDSCNCVHQDQSTVSISSNIRLYNFNFGCTSIDKCTSEQPTVLPTEPPTPDAEGYTPHDPIRETTANIELTKSLFNSLGNLALDGGAILISYSKKVNCAINDCKFNNCKAKNGGAIAASYSSAVDYSFKISQTIFSGCQADSRGGAVYIQSAQPLHHTFGITGCTFSGNKAYFGGGLYAELRDQLNLENCHFVNNEASKKGSSAYLKLGHENIKNSVEEHDTFKVHNNVFTFNPSTNNAVNVFIENDEITDTTDPAHANVYFGGNTFNIGSSRIARSEYLHLEIVENEGGFESITFDSCNCVKQGQSTVKVAENYQLNNFNFECTSIDTCTPNAGDTSTSSSSSISSESSSSSSISSESSSSSSISSESSSSSDVDKNINDSNQKNKSKIALTIGIAVAAVVVVVVIVVVVIIVIRKKSFGNYVHADEDDIAENLNGPSSNIELNNQDSAL